MKKINVTGKLKLNKAIVSKLNVEDLVKIKGGDAKIFSIGHYCTTAKCHTDRKSNGRWCGK